MRAVISARGHPERRVDRADNPVELGEQVVVVVGRAVGQDVRLGADQQLEAVQRRVELADLLDLRAQRVGRHVVAEAVRRRVVGDRQVLEPALTRRGRHLLDGVAPVRQRRVAVQVALEVVLRDQLRDLLEVQLAAALAQLRRDPGQAEQLVDLLLGRAAMRGAAGVVEQAVLADVQALAHRALAQRHVVLLGAREVLPEVAELVGLDDAQVDAASPYASAPAPRSRRATSRCR